MMHYTFQLPEFLVQKSLSAPTQVFQECWSEPSPPSQLHLPPPLKIQIWTDLGTLGLSWSEPPPPLPHTPKIQIWTDLGTLGFSWSRTPLQKGDFDRSWPFGFQLVWTTNPIFPLPQMQVWTDLGVLGLSWSGTKFSPPPPPIPDLCWSWCVETNHCPKGTVSLIL